MTDFPKLATGLFLIAAALTASAWGYPEPSIVSRSWQFEFTYSHPTAIAVKDDAGRTRWYWYMTYKVVNNTGAERVFVPSVTIATDDGTIRPANEKLPTAVFDAIKGRERNRLLEPPGMVVDKVLQGEDYARESVIVWPAESDRDLVHVTVFVSGLSGETATVTNPSTQEQVTLYKVLMLEYDLPGKPQNPQSQPVIFRNESWVMR